MKLPSKRIIIALASTILILAVITFIGDQLGFTANNYCPNYLGCVTGFFGFDAVQHFMGGIISLFLIASFSEMYPEYSLFHHNRVKNFIILVSVSVLLAFIWELGEMSHDAWRFGILHFPLTLGGKHQLDQPTNLDKS